jgi:hypothetical protein
MKTKTKLYLLAVSAAALSLNVSTSSGQVFNSADALNNQAVAASPRTKEVFPWLTRGAPSQPAACCDQAEVKNALTEAKKNPAYAGSPRIRELFPELGRTPAPQQEFTIAPLVEKNVAVLSSPRYREQHPALSRGTTPGTAKGGASDLMELGR